MYKTQQIESIDVLTVFWIYLWISILKTTTDTAHKMKFSNKNFFSKCDQICRKLWICSHLLKKSLTENFIFCAVECFPQTSLKYSEQLLGGNKENIRKSPWWRAMNSLQIWINLLLFFHYQQHKDDHAKVPASSCCAN